jgi:DICT domain-containing protein
VEDESDGFSIGELSRRTGVPVATLRTWEVRYGQPRARRRPSGHRRYDDDAVRAVGLMVGQRAAGLSLDAAASRLDASRGPVRSVFAALRAQHPELRTQQLTKPTLLAVTHAMEDEYLATAEPAVLFGAFQRARYVAQSRDRWHDLARASEFAAVLADFGDEPPVAEAAVIRAPLAADAALTREWLLVCDGPTYAACVVGREPAGQAGAREPTRRFETVWSLDPQVVRSAARICASHVAPHLADGGAALEARLSGAPPPASPDLARATLLFQRLVDYLTPRAT